MCFPAGVAVCCSVVCLAVCEYFQWVSMLCLVDDSLSEVVVSPSVPQILVYFLSNIFIVVVCVSFQVARSFSCCLSCAVEPELCQDFLFLNIRTFRSHCF